MSMSGFPRACRDALARSARAIWQNGVLSTDRSRTLSPPRSVHPDARPEKSPPGFGASNLDKSGAPEPVATKIKLMRLGKMREPHYRIVVADARTKRDGRSIETIGEYHPKNDPSVIRVDGERAAYWLGVGAQPTEAVTAILKVTGDWQKFKGEPAPEPMKLAPPKADKHELFAAALADAMGEPEAEATTAPRKRAAKAAPKAAAEAKTEEAPAEAVAEPAAAAEAPAEAAPDEPAES
jgi:small subunit ribosomal protein S16